MLFGYLDAGSGSLLLQAILGGAAGIAVAAKAWRARLRGKSLVKDAIAESEAGANSDQANLSTEP
ncbi:MAG TPA: hypothetical protein VGA97_07625 [Acidimicrobiia bacterium]|jgi:hypothetical protein